MDYTWSPWEQLRAAATVPWALSPWAIEQIPLLDAAGIGHGG
jgi:isopentenyl-diphosphate Delta-isomerase